MINSKSGNTTVFICIVLSALISITLTFVYAAHAKAVSSYADGVLSLSADSVTSEFDYFIQQDYGLFLLQGSDGELSRKARHYASYSLDVLDGVNINECKVSGSRYSTINTDLVQKQIITYMKTVGIIKNIQNEENQWSQTDDTERGHVLRHGPTIVSLPSRLFPDQSIVDKAESATSALTDLSLIFNTGTTKYLTDSYVLGIFNNDITKNADDHFFRNEVEYILSGKLSDTENVKKTDLALKALRFPSNLAHIYADPEKRAAVIALAETLTPGVLGTVTQAGIAAAWATAESINDVKLLHAGYKVPLLKDAESWAVDVDSLLNMENDNYLRPSIDKGRKYSDYLRILLFIEDDDIKIARILDLIQINMRRNYDAAFLIPESCCGIGVKADVNGKIYEFDRIY